jgi:hypothetical protein
MGTASEHSMARLSKLALAQKGNTTPTDPLVCGNNFSTYGVGHATVVPCLGCTSTIEMPNKNPCRISGNTCFKTQSIHLTL